MHNICGLLSWGVSCVALETRAVNEGEAGGSSRGILPTCCVRTSWVYSPVAPTAQRLPPRVTSHRKATLIDIQKSDNSLCFSKKRDHTGELELKLGSFMPWTMWLCWLGIVYKVKGRWFASWSGHMPGLQVRSPGRVSNQEAMDQ